MKNKNIRYVNRIIILDKNRKNISLFSWDAKIFDSLLMEQEKHYGLKLINNICEVKILIEYTNIIWDYKIYYGSYKQKYHLLNSDDEKWKTIETDINSDLKFMGIEKLNKQIISSLKNKEKLEYENTINIQVKKYCIKD